MKNWKSLLVTLLSFFAVAGMVVFNSCVKDPCTDLACRNGGTCSDGYCQCPTGYEGAECDITAASRFIGKWAGSVRCNNFPIQIDTVTVDLQTAPNKITVRLGQGNTSVLAFTGIAETPETHLSTRTTEGTDVNIYVRVDGGFMQMYVQTLTDATGERQNCYFSGTRIAE